MANTVFKLRRSSVAGKVPNTSSLAIGELALNLTDKKLYSSDGSAVWETGANLSSLSVANSSSVFLNVNSSVAAVNTNLNLKNNYKLSFDALSGSSNVYFIQQNDDNFVFYISNTSGGSKPVWSIYSNSATSNINFSVPATFSGNVTLGTSALSANGSTGSAGYVLTSNGSATYWVSPAVAATNTNAQFIWSNTHTFQANVSFTGNNISVVSNTGSILLNGNNDANWRIGRNTGSITKWVYTNNSIDVITANSTNEGFAIGLVSNATYFETGYLGTYVANKITVGSSTSNVTVNSTAITANSITIASSNTATFTNINGQTNASAGDFKSNAYASLGGYGGNYLAFGQQTNFHQWIQSGYSAASPTYYSIILNPLGGNIGIGNTNPSDKLSVNGTTYLGGNVTLGSSGLSANGSYGSAGQSLLSNGTATYWATAGATLNANNTDTQTYYIGLSNASSGAWTNAVVSTTKLYYVPSTGKLDASIVNASSFTVGTAFTANSTVVNAVSYYAGATLIANTTGPYGKTEGNLNVNNALTSNTASYLGNSSGTIANLTTWITGNSATAYTNAVSYTDGKIATANSAITGNAATAYTNAVSYVDGLKLDSVTNTSISYIPVANTVKNAYDRAIDANTRAASAQTAAASAYTNAVSYTDSKIATANSAITGNAATAYTNAVSYTDSKILTANSAITGNAATAYTNATTFASNGSNISSGTVAEARLPYRLNQNLRTTDTVEFNGMTLTGNLVVSGNVNIIGANNLSLVDNMIYLNANSTVTNPDIGISGNYNTNGYAHTGIFRDATDGFWKVYDNYGPEPDASPYIDTSNTTFHIANFWANTIYVGNTSVYATVNTTSFSGTANNASYLGGTAAASYLLSSTAASTYAPLTGTGASGTWSINITGTSRGVGTSDPAIGAGGLWVTTATGLNIARNGTSYIALDAGNYSSYVLPLSGGTVTGPVEISTGTSRPLRLTTSSSGPWALSLYRSDVASDIMVFNNNGYWYFGQYCYAPSFRAPIFYDSDNTGYYVDPTSSTSIRTAGAWHSDSGSWTGEFSGKIQYYSNHWYVQGADLFIWRNSGGSNVAYFNQNGYLYAPFWYDSNDTGYYANPNGYSQFSAILTNDWFRPQGETGVYSQSYGQHFYPDSGGYWWECDGGLRIRDGYEGDVKGHIGYHDANSFGILNSSGNWQIRIAYANMELYNVTYMNDARAYIFYDRNDTGYYCDPAGTSRINNIGNNMQIFGGYGSGSGPGMTFENQSTFLRTAFWDWDFYDWNVGSVLRLNSYAQSDTSMRAPIFYDSNNTGYYCDPNSGTRLAGTTYCDYVYSGGDIRSAGWMYATGRVVVGEGQTSSWLEMRDTDEGTRYIHNNSGTIGFVGSHGSWRFRMFDDGNVVMGTYQDLLSTQIRSNIFYKHDDTGYYLNPNHDSRLFNLNLVGGIASINVDASFNSAALEVREYNFGGAQTDSWSYAPRIGFHWANRVASQIAMNSSGWICILNNPGNAFENFEAGNIYATGNVTTNYSDERLKTILGPISNPIEILKAIKTFKYKNNDIAKENGFTDDDVQVGVSAQSVEKVLPEVVKHAPFDILSVDGKLESKSGEWYKTVQYEKLVPVLIEAIKEQQAQIDDLKRRLENN